MITLRSSELCTPTILKITACLLSRLFQTGKVQTKAETIVQKRDDKDQAISVYFRIARVHSSLDRSVTQSKTAFKWNLTFFSQRNLT